MPQPLSRVNPKADVRVRATALPPEFCVHITRTITAWAYSDHLLASMLGVFLNAEHEIVWRMYDSLTGGEARRAALLAAAQAAVPQHLDLINATLKSTKSSRDQRHRFAHHIWGISDELPDAMILIEPSALVEPIVKMREMAAKGLLHPKQTKVGKAVRLQFPPLPTHDLSKMMVYRERDFKEAANNAETCTQVILALSNAVHRTHPDEEARLRLMSEPRIQREIERLSRRNEPSAPPPQPPEIPPQ